jgi:hypothetical protein
MEKSFHFVNGISNDEKSKKLMRRHVMMSKNAGKKIQRRSRLDLQVTQSRPTAASNSSRISVNLKQRYSYADWQFVSPNRFSIDCGNAFLTFSVPVEVTPYSLGIINECENEATKQWAKILLKVFQSSSLRPREFIPLSLVCPYTMLNSCG